MAIKHVAKAGMATVHPDMDKKITSVIKCEMKLLIHSQTSTIQPVKFENE